MRNNQDVFAWSKSDMIGVPRDLIEHALNVDARVTPRKQKLRPLSEECYKALTPKFKNSSMLESYVKYYTPNG